jgi:hypothetical protein
MKLIAVGILGLALAAFAFADDDAGSAVHGTVTKVDSGAKTITVKSADGTEHVVHWTDQTAVYGARETETGAKDSWHGIDTGSEVVVHTTKRGTEDTAVEVDKVGKGGLKATEGTVKEIDRGGKKIVITTADGTDHTFKLTGRAAVDGAKGTEKGAKVVVYSTGGAAKGIAHFFAKL